MRKYIFFGMLFLISAFLFAAQQYTVILKNGKTMTGQLISESADGIVFKDADGVQFSLKKSALDLEKMQQANVIQPPPVVQEEELKEPPKKKGRIYTKEDLDELKTKYGDLTTADRAIENVEDYEGGVLKPEAHYRNLKDSSQQINAAVDGLTTLGNGVATAWEVADSTGKDSNEAIKTYVSDESTTELLAKTNSQIAALEDTRDKLAGGPEEYADAYKALSQAVDALKNYQRLVQDRSSVDNASLYRSRIQEISNQASSAGSILESLQPQEPAKKAGKTARPVQEQTEQTPPAETEEQQAPTEPTEQTQPDEEEEQTDESPDR